MRLFWVGYCFGTELYFEARRARPSRDTPKTLEGLSSTPALLVLTPSSFTCTVPLTPLCAVSFPRQDDDPFAILRDLRFQIKTVRWMVDCCDQLFDD